MAITPVSIPFDVSDILGVDYDARRTKLFIRTSIDGDVIVDADGNTLRVGTAYAKPDDNGVGSFDNLIPTNAATNPTGFQYEVVIDYPPRDPKAREHKRWSSGWFSLTADTNLADVIAEQYVPPTFMTTATNTLQGYVDQGQALRDDQAAIAGLTGEDSAMAYIDANASSSFRTQQDARLTATYARLVGVQAVATADAALVLMRHNPVDATSGNRTMTVPDATSAGQMIAVSKKDASTNTVTVSFAHLRDGGAGSITLVGQYEALTLTSKADGSWWPVADHKTKAYFDAQYAVKRDWDLEKDFGAVVLGRSDAVPSTSVQAANVAAMNNALSTILASPAGGTLVVPKVLYINDAITALNLTADTDANIRVVGRGAGNLSARIHQTDNTKDVFWLKTTTGNLRGLRFADFEVWFGKRQFWLSRAAYNTWENVRQRQNNEWAIYAENSSTYNRFDDHWIYECTSGAAANAFGSADLTFNNGVFGEAGGAIHSTSTIRLIGCQMLGSTDRINATGTSGAGPAALNIPGTGRIQIVGGDYSVLDNVFAVGNLRGLQVTGARFTVPAGKDFLQTTVPTSTGYSIRFTGCSVSFAGDGKVVNKVSGQLAGSQWVGNKFEIPVASTVTLDDALLDAGKANVWSDNLVARV